MSSDKERLYAKYSVARTDGKPLKGGGAIVLEFGDPLARVPLRVWVRELRAAGRTTLADDIERALDAIPGSVLAQQPEAATPEPEQPSKVRGNFICLTVRDEAARKRPKWVCAAHVTTVEAPGSYAGTGVRSSVTCWPFKAFLATETEEEVLALLERATRVRVEGVGELASAQRSLGIATNALRCGPARGTALEADDLPTSDDKEPR